MANANNVTAAKPKIGGAIFRAPLGTALPTDATSALNQAFKSLGYADDQGLTNNNSATNQAIKAWGGDTVLNVQNGKDDTFRVNLIEVLNNDVQKAVYGDANVTVADGLTTIKANATPAESCSWVVDMIMRDGVMKRIVVPNGTVTALGEIKYGDTDAVGYAVTISATPDASGNTHYEYIKAAS